MTAEIVILAEYRARKARVRYSVTFDPLVWSRAWWDWMASR